MQDRPAEIKDVYFRRFLVPVIIATLIFAAVLVIINSTPGAKPEWETYGSVFGAGLAQAAGALKRLRK